MTQGASRLERLVNLANESGSDQRRALLSEITSVFLEDTENHSDLENQYFGEIMGKVAFDLEKEVREELANCLSSEASAPRDLIMRLANDEISVAQPIIERSSILNDDDLVEIAKTKSQDHLMAMTRRSDISETVTDALVNHGSDQVLEGVVRNTGARISQTTMVRVVERSQDNESIQAPLIERPDLPFEMMQSMFEKVSMELKQKILKQTKEIAPEKLDDMLKSVRAKFDRKGRVRKKILSKPELYVQDLEDKGELKEGVLVGLIRANQYPEFLIAFGKLTDIDISTAKRLVQDVSGEGLAIACKATKFDRSTFSSILMALSHGTSRSIDETYKLINLYDRIQLSVAQRTMRFWRVCKQVGNDGTTVGNPSGGTSFNGAPIKKLVKSEA